MRIPAPKARAAASGPGHVPVGPRPDPVALYPGARRKTGPAPRVAVSDQGEPTYVTQGGRIVGVLDEPEPDWRRIGEFDPATGDLA
jgi:hypothetical protein